MGLYLRIWGEAANVRIMPDVSAIYSTRWHMSSMVYLPEMSVLSTVTDENINPDGGGGDEEIYEIKLLGLAKLGEGKPENQNDAIIFTRGEALQAIDMNQDNYLEEALKMRNLEEFNEDHGVLQPTILGVHEHLFTDSVFSLAWFMSNQETSFVTIGSKSSCKTPEGSVPLWIFLLVYGLSWLVTVAVTVILMIVSLGKKKLSVDSQLMLASLSF
ncbi:hypothetical protein K1719_043243 [Acacia pycnantha]|nr:hypothetical protein K1719_043243 [Acacia pycnantha]